jgi:hypothetical protein
MAYYVGGAGGEGVPLSKRVSTQVANDELLLLFGLVSYVHLLVSRVIHWVHQLSK